RRLSSSIMHAGISGEFQEQLAHYQQNLGFDIPDRPDEPYRQFSSCIAFRLRLALTDKTDTRAYWVPQDFINDLRIIRDSLATHKAERVALLFIDPVLRQADTFGFHLHRLDIRQHARVHAGALAALRGDRERTPEARDLLDTLRT